MKKNLSPELLEIIKKTVSTCGVTLYAVEFYGKTLKVFIDAQEKISIDTCTKVSQALSIALDMENIISNRYLLEVSSPGLERKLRNINDFQQSIGHTAIINTKNGRYVGRILSVNDDGVNIKNIAGSCAKANTEQLIPTNSINTARIVISNQELFDEAKKLHKH